MWAQLPQLIGIDGEYLRSGHLKIARSEADLAALALLSDLGHPVALEQVSALRRTLHKMERFRRALLQAFPWPHAQAAALPDAAVLCRCESITAGELRRAVTELGACEMNRGKALSRVGMGRCQGRTCGVAAAEILAHACAAAPDAVGRLRGQAPIKPLPFAAMARVNGEVA